MDQYAMVLRTLKKDELAQRVEERAKEIRDTCAKMAANPEAYAKKPKDPLADFKFNLPGSKG
ncbi:MAG: hypothetical protein AABY67_05010 [Nitrospirota bacterium]